MHQYGMSIPPDSEFTVTARSASGVQAIRHRERPVWGVSFHPEVRNEWVVEAFLELSP
jgi:GMP synthase (glutamine-hydrolysing)